MRGAERQYSDEELLGSLREFAAKHGRAPTSREAAATETSLPTTDTYVRRFGAWNDALEAAGLGSRPVGAPPAIMRVENVAEKLRVETDGGHSPDSSSRPDLEEVRRRLPTIASINDDDVRAETARLSADAPDYFWRVPASTSGYHHPACRQDRGLWIHTLMVGTVLERLADSYVQRGLLTEYEVDLARAAAVLHDQRKNGEEPNVSISSVSDHDLLMADVARGSDLDDRVANAIAAHMGPWYDGPEPSTPLEDLVHNADMVASTATITPAVPEPLPDELVGRDLEVIR